MNSEIRWKITSLLLLFICAALAYRVFDQGITRTYLDASLTTSDHEIQLLTGLIDEDWHGMTREQVMQHLEAFTRKRPPGSIVLENDQETGGITFDGVSFEFVDGKLAHVK